MPWRKLAAASLLLVIPFAVYVAHNTFSSGRSNDTSLNVPQHSPGNNTTEESWSNGPSEGKAEDREVGVATGNFGQQTVDQESPPVSASEIGRTPLDSNTIWVRLLGTSRRRAFTAYLDDLAMNEVIDDEWAPQVELMIKDILLDRLSAEESIMLVQCFSSLCIADVNADTQNGSIILRSGEKPSEPWSSLPEMRRNVYFYRKDDSYYRGYFFRETFDVQQVSHLAH